MKTPRIAVMVTCVLACFALAWTASQRTAVPPSAVVATVDLNKVLEGLHEKTAREADMKKRLEEIQTGLDKLKAQLADEDNKFKMLKDEDKKIAAPKLLKMARQYKLEEQMASGEAEDLAQSVLLEMYNHIDAACEQLAKARGYTMVLASDEQVPITDRGTTQEMRRAIAYKRMLWVDPAHDITDEVIQFMNNQFAVGAGGGGAGGGANPNPANANGNKNGKPKN